MNYALLLLLLFLVAWFARGQWRRVNLKKRCEEAFAQVYAAASPQPKFVMSYRYNYPAFAVNFGSRAEMQRAAESGMNEAFLQEIDGFCKGMGSRSRPFAAATAVDFITLNTAKQMHPEVATLVDQLEEAVELLKKHTAFSWAKGLERDVHLLRAGDAEGLRRFLSAFGGMGSLNDISLATPSDQEGAVLVHSPDNERFKALLEKAYSSAVRLLRAEEHI